MRGRLEAKHEILYFCFVIGPIGFGLGIAIAIGRRTVGLQLALGKMLRTALIQSMQLPIL